MNLLNITNINYEDVIKEVINEAVIEYKNLTKIQTCFIYSSIIWQKLKEKHIISRIISTTDLGSNYEHRFVLIPDFDNYYIIDLTYRQFLNEMPASFVNLYNHGYQKVDNVLLKEYLNLVSREPLKFNINEILFK